MLKLATENSPWAEVSDYELKRDPPSFTWDTIKYFKGQLKRNSPLFLIIGFDQWEKLSHWKNIEILALNVQKRLKEGRENRWLPQKVAKYIQKKDLYSPVS